MILQYVTMFLYSQMHLANGSVQVVKLSAYVPQQVSLLVALFGFICTGGCILDSSFSIKGAKSLQGQ